MADNTENTESQVDDESSSDDLADLALGDAAHGDDDEGEAEAEPEEESFWGSFKSYVPQAKELADLKAALANKESELAKAMSSKKLQLEDLFDEDTIKQYSAQDIEELAAALYFTIHPEKVDEEIAKGIKAKRESIAEKRRREKEESEIRTRAEEVAKAKEEADIRTYQADLRVSIADMSDKLPSLMKLAGGNRSELAKLVFEEVMEAVEAGVAKTADDIDPEKVLAGLERRASKVIGRPRQAEAPQKKVPLARGNARPKLRGIFAK